MKLKFDKYEKWLNILFKPYQAVSLNHLWDLNVEKRTGITSSQVYTFLQQTDNAELMKSMASVIFFLDNMVEEGLLSYEQRPGKGGYNRVYYPEIDRGQFVSHIGEMINSKLAEYFPSIPCEPNCEQCPRHAELNV